MSCVHVLHVLLQFISNRLTEKKNHSYLAEISLSQQSNMFVTVVEAQICKMLQLPTECKERMHLICAWCVCVCCSQEAGRGCCHGDAAAEECRRRGGGRPREEEDQRSQEREERPAGQTHQTSCSDWQSRQAAFQQSTFHAAAAAAGQQHCSADLLGPSVFKALHSMKKIRTEFSTFLLEDKVNQTITLRQL